MASSRDATCETPRVEELVESWTIHSDRERTKQALNLARRLERECVVAREAANSWKAELTALKASLSESEHTNAAPQVPATPRLEVAAATLGQIERQVSGPGPAVAATGTLSADATTAVDDEWAATHAGEYLKAILHYTDGFYGDAIKHGMSAKETANRIAHLESAARALHRIAQRFIDKSRTESASESITDNDALNKLSGPGIRKT